MSVSSYTHPKYRPDIDGLRTVAVLSVLIFHGFPQLLPGGFVGVDVFFVISGYLISSIIIKSLRTQQFSIWHFYERRIRRLFPVLIVVLAFSLAVGGWLLPPVELKTLAKHTVGGGLFIANLLLAADSGYFSAVSATNPLLHLWSLGIEEQFYLLWPLILWFFYWRRWPLWIAISLCLVASFAYSQYLTLGNLKLAFYLPFSRFWEMIAGAGLAWWALRPHTPPTRPQATLLQHLLSLAGVGFFVVALIILQPTSDFPGWRAAFPVLSAVCFIAAGPYALINRYVLSLPLMVGIGLISYPLYLWHWPLLAYFHGLSYAVPLAWHTPIICALLLLSGVLAWASYALIEKPLRGGAHGRLKLVGLCAAMVAVVAVAAGVWAAKGLPQRFASPLKEIIATDLRTPEWLASLRNGECHNMIYLDSSLNAAHCLPTQTPSIVVWGDSQAAALYSGIKQWGDDHGVAVGQMTVDATAPYFTPKKNNMGRAYADVSQPILQQLAQRPPSVILLHAFWTGHDTEAEHMQQHLTHSLAQIRAVLPDTPVLIVGAVPNWVAEPGVNIFNYSALNGTFIPPYTDFGLNPSAQVFNQRLKDQWADQPHVYYVAPTDFLCPPDQDGCLIRLPEVHSPADLAYVDSSHISTAAAHLITQQLHPLLEQLLLTPAPTARWIAPLHRPGFRVEEEGVL